MHDARQGLAIRTHVGQRLPSGRGRTSVGRRNAVLHRDLDLCIAAGKHVARVDAGRVLHVGDGLVGQQADDAGTEIAVGLDRRSIHRGGGTAALELEAQRAFSLRAGLRARADVGREAQTCTRAGRGAAAELDRAQVIAQQLQLGRRRADDRFVERQRQPAGLRQLRVQAAALRERGHDLARLRCVVGLELHAHGAAEVEPRVADLAAQRAIDAAADRVSAVVVALHVDGAAAGRGHGGVDLDAGFERNAFAGLEAVDRRRQFVQLAVDAVGRDHGADRIGCDVDAALDAVDTVSRTAPPTAVAVSMALLAVSMTSPT